MGRGRQVERRCGSRINRPQILTCGECLPSRQVRLRHDLEQSMRWCHFFLEGDKVALAKLFIPLRLLLPFSSFMFLFHSKFCLVLLSGSSVIVGHTHVQFSAAVSIFFFFFWINSQSFSTSEVLRPQSRRKWKNISRGNIKTLLGCLLHTHTHTHSHTHSFTPS